MRELSELLTKLAAALSFHVVPIFHDDLIGRPAAIGTGLLLVHLGRPYLATASHVVADHFEDGTLYFYEAANRKRIFTTNGYILPRHISPQDGTVEKLDVALFPLLTATEPSLKLNGRGCLNSSALSGAPPNNLAGDQSNKYLLTGYPVSKSKLKLHRKELESTLWSVQVAEASLAAYRSLKINPQTHLVLSMDDKDLWQQGRRVNPPHLHGVSGSPIWHSWNSEQSVETQDPRNIVIGFATEHKKNEKCIVAVRSTAIQYLLSEAARGAASFEV